MKKTFSNKVVLVTGASRGIGRATAIAFAREGAHVVVNYRRDRDGAEETCELVERNGGSAYLVQGDVSEEDDVSRMVARIDAEAGPINVLVNNAAVHSSGNFLHVSAGEFDRVLQTNTRGVYFLSQQVARGMVERREGSIILVSSILANVVIPDMTAYCASKGAIESLVRAMALDLAGYNIRVNAVRPGLIRTKMLLDTMQDVDLQRKIQRHIPVGRFGDPDEIASTIVFLASEAAAYITGAVIPVDGGLSTREAGPISGRE